MTPLTAPEAVRPAARTEAVLEALARLDDDELRGLLRRRPDLAVPPPASLGALAARATSRPSVERALTGLDQHVLEVAEAVCALHPLGPLDTDAVGHGVGADPAPGLSVLRRLLLVVDDVPVQALLEALGPYPAGLGPSLVEVAPDATVPLEGHAEPADTPPAAQRVLAALRDGPPVGVVGGEATTGVQWLLDHDLLHPYGATQVVLPLEVSLALRGGRTHPAPHPAPPPVRGSSRPTPTVAAESARAAEELVRLVELLVQRWAQEPAPALRSGGLGVRELGRLATDVELTAPTAATVIELAAAAGLVGDAQDREGTALLATLPAAADWLEEDLSHRWAVLATAWLDSRRASWLVGGRDERGTRLAALGPGLDRGWAARLRRRLVTALAELLEGTAPSPDELHAALTWSRPRATPHAESVTAVLTEAALVGVTGAGALSSAGRALVGGDTDGEASTGVGGPAEVDGVAAALAGDLPAPVAELLVQGDLTAVVPGRPAPDLADLLSVSSDVESRGAGLTVRFTDGSVRRALDAGWDAEELTARLAAVSRTPLPQALSYLIADTERRHGRLRVGAATSYLRTPDEATTREVLADSRLAALGLRQIAPTVLVSSVAAPGLARVLGETLGGALLEGTGGATVPSRRERRAAVRPAPSAQPEVRVTTLADTDLDLLVRRLRTAPAPTSDPGHAVTMLREAAAAGEPVAVVLVGPSGATRRHRVRPLAVEGGRARLHDLDRRREIAVAVHRISAVGPVAEHPSGRETMT